MAAKDNSGMKRNQPGGCVRRRQRNDSWQREHGPSEELILNKDAGPYPTCLRISKNENLQKGFMHKTISANLIFK